MNDKTKISWWSTTFGDAEIQGIAKAMKKGSVSQGAVTVEFEKQLAETLNTEHVVCTTSGSMALLMALMVCGVESGDEVIVPNRTWIATAHAPLLLGARPVLVDVEPARPIIDASLIERHITRKTKAIIPVHLNGRSADMNAINSIAKKHEIAVIEDAAQAIGSQNRAGFLGTQSDIGCFSLSIAKTISTGQGGFLVTRNEDIALSLRAIRTHGVENVIHPKGWIRPGFNFRFTDMQAAIGLVQLKSLRKRIQRLKEIYRFYREGLAAIPGIRSIPVDLDAGEVPVYNEAICVHREAVSEAMDAIGIEIRPFYPDLDRAEYMKQASGDYPNSRVYEEKGICLPSGPALEDRDIHRVIDALVKAVKK